MDPPKAIGVSACADKVAGARRIAAEYGLRFDAPENGFRVRQGFTDMPPERNYAVSLNVDAGATLVILGPLNGGLQNLQSSYPTFSKSVGQRTVRDARGRNFGTDRWGYLPSGERWRYVKFSTGNQVGYEPLATKDADRLDEIINTACFVQDEKLK